MALLPFVNGIDLLLSFVRPVGQDESKMCLGRTENMFW